MSIIKYTLLGAFAYWLFNQASDLLADYKKITSKITKLSNVNLGFEKISFTMDIQISNPTATNMTIISNEFITLVKIHIYTSNGTYVATATPQPTVIDLPPNSVQLVENIPSFIETKNIPGIATHLSNFKALQTKLEFKALGQTVSI